MTPEAGHFLAKAHKLLGEADGMLAMQYHDAAGRTAYLAGFHAAQAFIFEHNGRAAKTHNGAHTEFQRLTKDNRTLDPELRAFLSRSYNLKSIADYETGPSADVSPEKATEAVETAKRFVASWPNSSKHLDLRVPSLREALSAQDRNVTRHAK